MFLGILLILVGLAWARQAVPVVVGSHRLVEGLRSEVKQPFHQTQNVDDVTHMLKRLVTECSADTYVILNMPGLENKDLTDKKLGLWPNLQKYLHMLSSVVGLPWMEGTLDLAFLETYITRTCQAETIEVTEEEDVHYRDTRKRIIKIEFNPLPEAGPERDFAIRENDEMLRKVLRRTPSPHYAIILTLTTAKPSHPIPEAALEQSPERWEIFHLIVNDPKRTVEEEKHKHMYQAVEPVWNENKDPMSLYLERKLKDQIHLRDYEHWKKNERLVTAVAAMVVSVVLIRAAVAAKRVITKRKTL